MHDKGKCSAFREICNYCGERYHFARMCRSKSPAQIENLCKKSNYKTEVNEVQEKFQQKEYRLPEEGDIESVAFLGECTVNSNNPWLFEVRFNSVKISKKVDTGADVSILNYDSYLKLSPLPKLDSPTKKLLQMVHYK